MGRLKGWASARPFVASGATSGLSTRSPRGQYLPLMCPQPTDLGGATSDLGELRSWRLKLARAEHHFNELKSIIGVPLDRQPCPVTEVLNSNNEWEYILNLGLNLDRNIAIVAGDVLFNIRCALDHLLCALIPGEDKGVAMFPIFTEDPFEVDEVTGNYRHSGNARRRWKRQTLGVPDDAMTLVTLLQPFTKTRQAGKRPDQAIHHTLAVLAALQNADKHWRLIFSKPTLKRARIFREGVEVPGLTAAVQDGTPFLFTEEKMDVKVDGFISIPFGIGNNLGYEFPLMFNMIFESAREIIPTLERLIPE